MVSIDEAQLKLFLDEGVKILNRVVKDSKRIEDHSKKVKKATDLFKYFFNYSIDLSTNLNVLEAIDSESTVYHYKNLVFKTVGSFSEAENAFMISNVNTKNFIRLERILTYFNINTDLDERKRTSFLVSERIPGPTFAKRYIAIKNSNDLPLHKKKEYRDYGINVQLLHSAYLERKTDFMNVENIKVREQMSYLIKKFSEFYDIPTDKRLNKLLIDTLYSIFDNFETKVCYTDRNPTNVKIFGDNYDLNPKHIAKLGPNLVCSLDFNKFHKQTVPQENLMQVLSYPALILEGDYFSQDDEQKFIAKSIWLRDFFKKERIDSEQKLEEVIRHVPKIKIPDNYLETFEYVAAFRYFKSGVNRIVRNLSRILHQERLPKGFGKPKRQLKKDKKIVLGHIDSYFKNSLLHAERALINEQNKRSRTQRERSIFLEELVDLKKQFRSRVSKNPLDYENKIIAMAYLRYLILQQKHKSIGFDQLLDLHRVTLQQIFGPLENQFTKKKGEYCKPHPKVIENKHFIYFGDQKTDVKFIQNIPLAKGIILPKERRAVNNYIAKHDLKTRIKVINVNNLDTVTDGFIQEEIKRDGHANLFLDLDDTFHPKFNLAQNDAWKQILTKYKDNIDFNYYPFLTYAPSKLKGIQGVEYKQVFSLFYCIKYPEFVSLNLIDTHSPVFERKKRSIKRKLIEQPKQIIKRVNELLEDELYSYDDKTGIYSDQFRKLEVKYSKQYIRTGKVFLFRRMFNFVNRLKKEYGKQLNLGIITNKDHNVLKGIYNEYFMIK